MNKEFLQSEYNYQYEQDYKKTDRIISLSVRHKIEVEEKFAKHIILKLWAAVSKDNICYLYARFGLIRDDAPIVTVGFFVPSIHRFISR